MTSWLLVLETLIKRIDGANFEDVINKHCSGLEHADLAGDAIDIYFQELFDELKIEVIK